MHWTERNQIAADALSSARFVTASGFARADCPFCVLVKSRSDRNQCLAINVQSGWYKCWRCHTSGRIDGVEFEGTVQREQQGVEPPQDFYPLAEEPAISSMAAEPAKGYLCSRGLTDPEMWREARLGVCFTGKYANRVVVPVLSPAGEWWGWVSRLWTHGISNPYRNAPGMVLESGVFNHAALLEKTQRPVMVVEGCFDALPYWPDAVALLGKPKEPQLASLSESERPMVIVLDGDSWEESEMLSMQLQFKGKDNVGWLRLPPKQDPNSVDPVELRKQVDEVFA